MTLLRNDAHPKYFSYKWCQQKLIILKSISRPICSTWTISQDNKVPVTKVAFSCNFHAYNGYAIQIMICWLIMFNLQYRFYKCWILMTAYKRSKLMSSNLQTGITFFRIHDYGPTNHRTNHHWTYAQSTVSIPSIQQNEYNKKRRWYLLINEKCLYLILCSTCYLVITSTNFVTKKLRYS